MSRLMSAGSPVLPRLLFGAQCRRSAVLPSKRTLFFATSGATALRICCGEAPVSSTVSRAIPPLVGRARDQGRPRRVRHRRQAMKGTKTLAPRAAPDSRQVTAARGAHRELASGFAPSSPPPPGGELQSPTLLKSASCGVFVTGAGTITLAAHLNTRRFQASISGPIFRPEAPYPPLAKTPII